MKGVREPRKWRGDASHSLPEELADVAFPVTEVTALDIVLEFACPRATSRVRQLEWPWGVREAARPMRITKCIAGGPPNLTIFQC